MTRKVFIHSGEPASKISWISEMITRATSCASWNKITVPRPPSLTRQIASSAGTRNKFRKKHSPRTRKEIKSGWWKPYPTRKKVSKWHRRYSVSLRTNKRSSTISLFCTGQTPSPVSWKRPYEKEIYLIKYTVDFHSTNARRSKTW